jgi:hypothetical protein
MEDINARIKQEICYETLNKISDAKLINECRGIENSFIYIFKNVS